MTAFHHDIQTGKHNDDDKGAKAQGYSLLLHFRYREAWGAVMPRRSPRQTRPSRCARACGSCLCYSGCAEEEMILLGRAEELSGHTHQWQFLALITQGNGEGGCVWASSCQEAFLKAQPQKSAYLARRGTAWQNTL